MTPWFTGFFEGEGTLTYHGQDGKGVALSVTGTDQDVMQRAAAELGTKLNGPYKYKANVKPFYMATVRNLKAMSTMVEIFDGLGSRRRQKIEELLSHWEHDLAGAKHRQ